MLLFFDEEHKMHLSFLNNIDIDAVREFFRISIDFLKKGTNPKVYQSASQKLGVTVDVVQHAVEGLMFLISESTKLKVSSIDLHDSIMTLGFSKDLRDELLELYETNSKDMRAILTDLCLDTLHYHNLEWRLDVVLASRSLRRQITPKVMMKLTLKEHDETTTKLLQTDPANLLHLTNNLENALKEIKSGHCKRIERHIK